MMGVPAVCLNLRQLADFGTGLRNNEQQDKRIERFGSDARKE